ncbi:MAG: hypothetical protein H6686_04350 [Fibrobacteria bacterium]|nr:hypothetical protein [Fibrobacteria bacterium]
MIHLKRILPGILAIFLLSCGSDKTADGGTGSDFPIHPAIAVVVERDGHQVEAEAWSLWNVVGDSVRFQRQVSSTKDGGFALPDTGSWIVEAWESQGKAGATDDLHPLPRDSAFERCLNRIGRSPTGASATPALLGACKELSSPTVSARGTVQQDPRAVAAFRLPDPSVTAYIVRDSLGKPLASRFWRLWRMTADISGPFTLFAGAGFEVSHLDGSFESSALRGTWVAEGWTVRPPDSVFYAQGTRTALETSVLEACLGSSPRVAPKPCAEPLFDPSLYGELPLPDAVLVLRQPFP